MFWWCYIHQHRLSGEMHSFVHMHNVGGGGRVLCGEETVWLTIINEWH